MIVVMKAAASKEQLREAVDKIEALGYRAHVMEGAQRNVIGCLGDEGGKSQLQVLNSLAGVEKVVPILSPYKLAGSELKPEPTAVTVSQTCSFGKGNFPVIAGPCSVESEEQIVDIAVSVKNAGANALRGGAFKPRSSTYSFQGFGEDGLKMLQTAKQETGLPIVTEIVDHHDLELVLRYADVLQVGARNMQNYALLKALGAAGKPVLLKRGMSATVEELLLSAEYILAAGNSEVILCERGIRTYETATRNTLDLNAIPALRERTHLPIVVDPSHGTGVWKYVSPMAKAGLACGADGLIIEVHANPPEAFSDGAQSLKPKKFSILMKELHALGQVLQKNVGTF